MTEKKILVVDDSQFMRIVLKDIITAMGGTSVIEAENGEDAIAKYKEYFPDLVTMDLVMPKVGGLAGLKGIIEADPAAKVIMVTAVDQQKSLTEATKLGAVDFIVKPFEEELVVTSIKKALGLRL